MRDPVTCFDGQLKPLARVATSAAAMRLVAWVLSAQVGAGAPSSTANDAPGPVATLAALHALELATAIVEHGIVSEGHGDGLMQHMGSWCLCVCVWRRR